MGSFGRALGSIARYGVGLWIYEYTGTRLPYGTFVVNISGCFTIGFVLTLPRGAIGATSGVAEAIPIGFIGAYTFSTFEYETMRLVQYGQTPSALLYVLLSVVTGYAAVWAGTTAGRPLA
ncbi:MAG: CrcB family protein [Silvibacterium sp.]